MSFETEVVKDGRGVVWKLDISLDGFATIAYRYSTAAGIDADFTYDPRIIGLGNLSRSLGEDHYWQTTSVEIAFDNTDEQTDWMADQSTAADVLKAKAKFYIGLFDPDSPMSGGGIEWKQLGQFRFGEYPTRSLDRVTAVLMDETAGFLQQPVRTPSPQEWRDADPDCPIDFSGYEWTDQTIDAPMQLAFGDDYVACRKANIGTPQSGLYADTATYVVCCTRDTADVTDDDVTDVWADSVDIQHAPGAWIEKSSTTALKLPKTVTSIFDGTTVDVWTVHKSATVTVDGRDFRILWVALSRDGYLSWYWGLKGYTTAGSSSGPVTVTLDTGNFGEMAPDTIWAKGFPLSAMTVKTQAVQHPADIATDLISYYSLGSSSNVDSTRMSRVKGAFKSLSAAGTIAYQGGKTLADHLSELAGSFFLDACMTWEGKVSFAAALRDYESITSVLLEFDETRIADVSDGIPSREQRGAPFNVMVLRDTPRRLQAAADFFGHMNWEGKQIPFGNEAFYGWDRQIARDIHIPWMVEEDLFDLSWRTLNLDITPRPRLQFTTDLEAIRLELGDYFKVSWTRNLGDPYVSTIFQVVGLSLQPESLTVRIEALWSDDLASLRPYILDDESYLTRATGGSTRTATVTDSSSTVLFSSGDLVSDGVEVGDHLILTDSTEAATSFKRNKALKITGITDATHLTVSDPLDSLDFDAPSGVAVSSWEIRRSHITYPTAASDSVNYPDGGSVYGRVSNGDSSGVYSGNGTGGFTSGHQLLDG